MRFSTRRGQVASYAAVVGDRYLWVALASGDEVSLRSAEGTMTLPSVTDDTQPGHHATRLDLWALPEVDRGEHQEFAVHAGPRPGRPLGAPDHLRSDTATTHRLVADDAGLLRVVRRPDLSAVDLRSLRLDGERVEIVLDGDAHEVRLCDGDTVVAVLPVGDGTAVVRPDDLATAVPGRRLEVVAVGADGPTPVRRRDNTLGDPGEGALLPAVHPDGAADALGRLRWSGAGLLGVQVHR